MRKELRESFEWKQYEKAGNIILTQKNVIYEFGDKNDPIGHELFRKGDSEGLKFLIVTNPNVLNVIDGECKTILEK